MHSQSLLGRIDQCFADCYRELGMIVSMSAMSVASPCLICSACLAGSKCTSPVRIWRTDRELSDATSHAEIKSTLDIPSIAACAPSLEIALTGAIRKQDAENSSNDRFRSRIRLLESQVDSIFEDHTSNLRRLLIDLSMTTPDSSSFTHKSLKELRRHLDIGGASVFLEKPANSSLFLEASTGIQKIIDSGKLNKDERIKKSDIAYRKGGGSFVMRCFEEDRYIQEFDVDGLRANTYGENSKKIYSRLFHPIRVIPHPLASSGRHQPIGVIRIINIERRTPRNRPPSAISLGFLAHYSEYMCVLLKRYMTSKGSLSVLNRATHGFKTDLGTMKLLLDGSRKAYEQFRSELTSLDSNDKDALHKCLLRHDESQHRRIRDLLIIQDYMANQLHAILDKEDSVVGSIRKGMVSGSCLKPYSEVFARLYDTADSLSRLHGRPKAHLRVEKLLPEDEDSIYMPSLEIEPSALFQVLRNLVENSIKYAPVGEGAEIRVQWQDEDSQMIVLVSDQGTGIPESEIKHLFVEEYRGRHAIELSKRGHGIGLAIARTSMRRYGGDLVYTGSYKKGVGAVFQINILRT